MLVVTGGGVFDHAAGGDVAAIFRRVLVCRRFHLTYLPVVGRLLAVTMHGEDVRRLQERVEPDRVVLAPVV
jgi:L-ascorbate metabolism protein UlaG (beta-lactamase superfamily)